VPTLALSGWLAELYSLPHNLHRWSGFGVILFDGLFVSILALLEWRHRYALVD